MSRKRSTAREKRNKLIRASVDVPVLNGLVNSTVGFWPMLTGRFTGSATALTWIPTGHLVLVGDFDTVVFGRFVGNTALECLRSVARASDETLERFASTGMRLTGENELLYEYNVDAAREDLIDMEARGAEALGVSPEALEPALLAARQQVRAGEVRRASETLQAIGCYDMSRYGGGPLHIGRVLSARVIRAHQLIVHLAKLVDPVEKTPPKADDPVPGKPALRLV